MKFLCVGKGPNVRVAAAHFNEWGDELSLPRPPKHCPRSEVMSSLPKTKGGEHEGGTYKLGVDFYSVGNEEPLFIFQHTAGPDRKERSVSDSLWVCMTLTHVCS